MIGEHGNEFDERNLFLQVALGLLSASRKVDTVLARHGHRNSNMPAMNTPEDEQLLQFVLGVISFRNQVVKTLESARRTHPAASEARVNGPPLQELLR